MRLAIVTGALGGVGRATVDAFREAGWRVIGIDREAGPASAACDQFWQLDIAAQDSSELRDRIAGAGPIAALVNNAALQIERWLLETEPADWDLVMATNVRAAALTIKFAHDGLRAARGAVVNVSSVHAAATSVGLAAYATSKGALAALTRVAALELARDGIRVNAVLPGAIDTPMLHRGLANRGGHAEAPTIEALGRRVPLGRIGRPDEIAHAILFLADGVRSSYVTGTTLIVDGGVLARLSSE